MSVVHEEQPVIRLGPALTEARGVVILLHGRGASAQSMTPLAQAFGFDDVAYLIPQAGMSRWYPNSAFVSLDANEPDLTSALNRVQTLVEEVTAAGVPLAHIIIGGFSQGACLSLEFAARNAMQYGGVFAYTGALIGPSDTVRDSSGSLEGVPIFLGTSDKDPWVHYSFQQDSVRVLEGMGAVVDFRVYPDMGHTVNDDEIEAVQGMIGAIG